MKYALIFLFTLLLVACDTEIEQVTLEEDVAFLASDSLGGRQTGTAQELIAAQYIAQRFESMGLSPKGDAGSYMQTFSFEPKTDPHGEVQFIEGDDSHFITGANVIGFLDHEAPTTVVIGAHYDHLGMGGEASLYREGAAIHNGADDNASGVAVMLQLAQSLQDPAYKQNNYLFIAFSGEEMGLLGSNFFTKNPTIPLESVNYMINMDMVGRLNDENALAVHGTGTSPRLSQTIFSVNVDFEIAEHKSGVGPSDHTSFYLNDVPVLHFFTGQHEDYHKPTDDAEKLNYEGMRKLQGFVEDIVIELGKSDPLVFTKTKDESQAVPSFKVGLGVVPDYLYSGPGMRIDGVSDGRAAANAGLQKGDIVVKMGDSTVTDMMSYMRVLSTFDLGDTTVLAIQRDGEALVKEITFVEN